MIAAIFFDTTKIVYKLELLVAFSLKGLLYVSILFRWSCLNAINVRLMFDISLNVYQRIWKINSDNDLRKEFDRVCLI